MQLIFVPFENYVELVFKFYTLISFRHILVFSLISPLLFIRIDNQTEKECIEQFIEHLKALIMKEFEFFI